MKSNKPFISARMPYLHLLTVVCLSLYTLSACQKTPEPDTPSQDAAIETTSNAADIERIARGETDKDIPALTGWRYDVFGKKARSLLTGKLALSFEEGQVRLFEPKA